MGVILFFLLFPFFCFGQEALDLRPIEQPVPFETNEKYIPWLTGTILTPSGVVVPAPHFRLKPVVLIENRFATYNGDWHAESTPHFLHIRSFFSAKFGLTQNLDLFLIPQWIYNQTESISSNGFGDLRLGFEFQLYRYTPLSWFPSTKLIVQETFPTGKYQKLNPSKQRTDAIGSGSYSTFLALGFSHLFHFQKHHFLEMYAAFGYEYFVPCHVRKFNTYGGADDTNGTAYPGSRIISSLGMEYTLTQRWVFAMDLRHEHRNSSRFKGEPGYDIASGKKAAVTRPSSEQFIIAPQLEYNWSADIGMIAGPWFTFAGRNRPQFNGGIIEFSYYH